MSYVNYLGKEPHHSCSLRRDLISHWHTFSSMGGVKHNSKVLHGCRLANNTPEEAVNVQACLILKEQRLQSMQQNVELAGKAKVCEIHDESYCV